MSGGMDRDTMLPAPGRKVRKIIDAHGVPISPNSLEKVPEPEPRQLKDSSIYDYFDDAEASIEEARKLAQHKDIENVLLSRSVRILKTAVERANKNVFKYGDHLSDCSWHDLRSSGRILRDLVEEEHCSCGWAALKTRLEDELDKEDIDE